MNIRSAIQSLFLLPAFRKFVYRYGPAFWRVPASVRWRLCSERQIARLPGIKILPYGKPERVQPVPLPPSLPNPGLGLRIAARPYHVPAPFIAELDRAWLVGEQAAPVTINGRVLMTAYRDEAKFLTLERQTELVRWVEAHNWVQAEREPDYSHVCSFVSRLDPNYFHWMVQWCGQVEGLAHYQAQTGIIPKILIRANSPRFVRASLELLGYGSDTLLEWQNGQEPLLIENLIVPSLPGIRVACSPRSLSWLRAQFLAAAGVDAPSLQAHRRLYISRKPGGWRSVINEEDVVNCLEQEGFEILRAENLSLTEQIRLFSEAKLIVGLHGAGLTNVLFAPQAALLEIRGNYGGGEYYSMTSGFGQQYEVFSAQSVGEDVQVDTKELLATVRRFDKPLNPLYTSANLCSTPSPT